MCRPVPWGDSRERKELSASHRIPNEAYAADYVAVGKVLKVCVEFSLVEPQGGLHFVVPENPFKHQGRRRSACGCNSHRPCLLLTLLWSKM